MKFASILLSSLLLLPGCAPTVTPVTVKTSQPSWDGKEQNSGLIAIDVDHNGVITPHARDRYNILNLRFNPKAELDEGVAPTGTNTFIIDAEHLARFANLRDKLRQQGQ